MRKFLLSTIAVFMSVAMMAIGKGDGTSKANAIDFDWANGHKPALSAGSWYRVSLSPLSEEAYDPTLALYLTNLTDETASVKLTMQAELLGQSVNQNSSYNIAGKDFQLWSRQSFDYNGRVMSLKQLMSAGLKEVYLQLTSNKEIALSAKVYETEDIVDDACTKAKDFDWAGVNVPKGEQWFRLNLSEVKQTDNKLKFVVTNNGGAEAKVSFDMSLDCPASAVIEKDWEIAPGADMEDEFGRVFLDVLKEDYVFLKLTNDQPLTLRVEEEIVVIPPGKYDDFDCASAPELAFDTELDLTAGQHIYKVKRDALLGGRSLASEFYVTNNGATPANLTVETAFTCPVKSTVDQSLVIEGNTTIVKAIKDNVLKSVDVEWVYLRFITDQDLTATVGKRNIDPCANAVPFDWTVGASLAAGESQWYEVDITSLKRDKKHLTLAFTNHSDNVALVNVELALDCNGTIMPITLPIYGGLSIGHTIDYNLLKHSPLNRIYVGLSTDSHIEMAASVKDAIAADPTPCQNALNPEHGVEYTHEANTTHWYKISLDLLESTADYSSLYLSNKGNQRAHVTFGVVTDCQYTPSNRITLPMPTKFDLGLLGPNVLGKLLKELARIERLYSKVDSKDIYLEIHSDQPIGFGLDVINAATSPCLRSDLITFDWNKGAKVEKGDGMKWFDMDLDAVKAAGKHVKLTFTNHSDSLVWAATMVSVECPAKLTMPLLVPVPAGMSVDHVINYQLFAVADLHNIYIGVVTDGELELKAESIDATILPPANCLNAQVIVSGKEYVQNAGTQWYQFPMSLIDEMGSAAKISFKNLTSNHATLSAGVTVGCEYPVNTIAKAKAPRDIQFSLNVPKFIISKVRGLIDPALTDFYIQLTTDQKIAFTLNNQATDVRACSNAIDFDWKTWEQDGLQLEANKANWYKVNFEYVFEKLEKGEDISVGLTNPSKNMDVAVDLAVSPTCPVVLSLEKSVNIPAGTSAGVKVSYDQLMSLIDKYDKYDLYGRDYEGMLKKINAYVLYNKLDQMLTERGYDEYIPLYRIEPLVDRYGEAASLVNLKALLDNPRKYISVAEIKERLEPVKVKIQNEVEERMSFDYMIGLLETYGDKIPKVDAEQIINNADLLLPYIGSANVILDKCKQYISKEDLKQHLVDIVNRIPFDEVKEFFQRVENKLKQYMPEPNTFYIYVKTTGELVINPEIPVAPECEGIVDTIVAEACDTFVWKGIPYTESGIYRDSTSASEPADAAFLDWKQTVKLSEFSEPWYKLDISEIKTNKLDFKLSLENDLNTTLNYTIELYDCYLEPMLSGSSDVEGGLLNRTVTYAEFMKYTDGLDCDYLYLRNVNYDCDRFEELHLTINKSVKVDTTIVACDSLEWNGSVYTVSGDYTDTLVAANGCDSIVTLHLTVENCTVPDCTVTGEETVVACDSYDWNGNTYTTSGDYVDTITLANGCDSIVTLHLTINQSVSGDEYVTVCYAAGETINGNDYGDTPGEYTEVLTLTAANGCDSVITYHITVLDEIPETYITEEICEGGSFELGGVIFTQAVVDEPVFLQSVDGCDSLVYVTIIVKDCKCENAADSIFNVVICKGEKYTWRGHTYTGETHVTVAGTDANGCSIDYTLNLTVAGETHYVTACDSYTYTIDGQTFTQTATGTYTHQLAGGCEYVLNLTINHSEVLPTEVVSSCGAYVWPVNGQVYYKSGEYQHNDTTSEGCTLTYTLNLTVTYVEDTVITAVICEGDEFEWRGNKYSVEGTYTDTAAINGCEATHTLHLVVAKGQTLTETACDSYTIVVDGKSYTYTESIKEPFELANGCDFILDLTINKSEKETYTVTACDSYEWHGTIYEASGEYIYNTTTAAGCDRVETLNLTINHSVVINDTVTTCEPFVWDVNGQTYDATGEYNYTGKTADGCDLTATLDLTIYCPDTPCVDETKEYWETADCSYTWDVNGVTYDASGDYTHVTDKGDGCTLTEILHLTVNPCAPTPEIPGNPCLDAIPFDWTTGAYLAADSCAWYEMDITSLVDNKQHLTLTFTNHSDTTALVLAVFALDCEGKMAPMLLPIPGGLSIDQTIDYQLLKRSPLKRIYVGVCTDSDIELASSVESAIAEDPAPCLNATNIEYDVKYVHNPGTSWYKVSTELLKNKSDLTGIYFANKGNKRAHATVGMVADCQYTTGTTITLPIPTGFEFSVMAPNILGKLMRELASFEKAINELDVKEIYVEITTDETIEFELSTREVNDACETAIELDWKEWEARGLQLKANEEVWYAVNVNYLLEKFINEKEITLAVSNLDSVDVDVEMSLSPTCPVMVTLDKTFTVPAGISAKKTLNSDDMLQWLAKYEKYVPYEQIKLIVEKYEGRYTVEELKEMIKNYEKYISVAQLKQELAKHKEYISYEEIVAELKKYGEYIPYDKAKTLLEKYEFFIKYYAGGAIALLDKCEPYITMDNFKKIVDYCSQYIPYEDLKQLFTIFKDYLTNDLHCYLRVKTTGDLYVGPKPLPTPCVDVVEELTVEACESYEWKGYTFTQSGKYTESKPLADPAKAEFLDWTQPIKLSEFTEPWYKLDVSDVIANKSDFSLLIENDYDSTLNVILELYSDPTDWFMYSITKDVEPGTYPKTLTYAEFEQNIGTEYDVLYLRNVNYDCELVEILNLTINNSVETEDYVKACGDYTWNGVVYNMSGDYTQTLSTVNGCDSIVTLHLTILPTDDIVTNVAICEGESYTWDVDDVTYTGTSYVEVAGQNDSGCDVTYILNLIVMNQDTIDVTVCDGPYVIEVGGVQHTFDQSGTYAISNGDCATVLNLTINQSQVVEYTEVACGSYTWHGNTYTESGDYTFIGTTDEGCELTEVLYLTINPAEDVEEYVSICEGESYTWPRNGQTYNETTTATFVGANDYGCEVTYTLHVEVIANEYKKVTACDSYTYNGVTYTESGVYTVSNGTCKLILDLTINETGFNYYDEVACDSYEWNGNTYTESGIYYNYGGFANGCPLVEVLRLTINKSEVLNSIVTTCEPYEWYGKVYDQTGKYTYSGTTADGCSLEATLDLTIFCPTPDPVEVFDTIAEYVCDGTEYVDPNTGKKHIISSLVPATLTWDEVVTTADTIYYYHYVITPIVAPELLDDAALALIPGATPVLTQGLVPDVTGTTEAIKAYYVDNDADDIADVTAVYWDAASLTVQVACGAVTHTMNLVVETECDNVLTSTHTFEVPALGVGVEENVTICAGETYVWNGKTYNATGTYEVTLTGATGCDSIATLNLTVLPAIAETVTEVTLCAGESYTWEVTGTTYNATTTESIVLKSVNGCDSVVTLNLTVLPAIAETVTEVTICAGESYTWDVTGTTYNATTTESIVLKSVNDCDSVVTLKLTVLPVIPETTDEATICAGETYTWSANGKTYNTTTTDSIVLKSVNDCDSVVTLKLTVLPEIPETTENVTICYGETYTWVETGKAYTTTTTESVTLKSVNGCDSVVTLKLTVLPEIPETTENVTICYGETYTWSANGKTYNTTTTESIVLKSVNDCDSVVTLNLTVLDPIAETVEYATVCAGETYTWSVNGKTYNATTTESVTLKSVNDCDSVVTLNLTVLPEAVTETEDLVVCESELPYVWRGEVLSAAGTYTVVEQYEEFACDSVIHVLNLQVYTLTLPASVADPIAVCGNPVDVTAANADIDAHIASNLYAPNATVTWYIMKNGTWTALTDELLKGSDESVTLKYIITTDCGSIESERFENIPVEMPTPINDVDMDNLPVESKYGHRVLLLNLNAIMATHGWTPEPEEVKWYRVVNDLDVYGEPGDDEFTGVTGHYFNYVDASVMSGQYYALIVHNTVEHPDECELYMRTEVITCSTNGIAPRLLPNVARPNENMKLVDLNPEEITEIRVYSTTGELMDTYVADQVAEFIIKAAQVSGYYMVDVETQNNKVTLRYVVK